MHPNTFTYTYNPSKACNKIQKEIGKNEKRKKKSIWKAYPEILTIIFSW